MINSFDKQLKFLFVCFLFFSFGCSKHEYFHGTRIGEENINYVILGETSFDEFKNTYGEPNFLSTFDDYIYYSFEHVVIPPGGSKTFLSRELVTIKLNDENKIQEIKFSDLTENPELVPAPEKTEVKGSGLSFINQIFTNLRSGSFI